MNHFNCNSQVHELSKFSHRNVDFLGNTNINTEFSEYLLSFAQTRTLDLLLLRRKDKMNIKEIKFRFFSSV